MRRGGGARTRHALTLARALPLPPLQSHSATTSATTPDQAASATPGGGSPIPPFHLAIPVADIDAAPEFFGSKLGCPEGRSAATWVDFNLAGHQLVCHEVPGYDARSTASAVDGAPVPVPHFGLALPLPDFQALAARVASAVGSRAVSGRQASRLLAALGRGGSASVPPAAAWRLASTDPAVPPPPWLVEVGAVPLPRRPPTYV